MSVKQAINLAVGSLVAALLVLTINAVFTAGFLSRAMQKVSLHQNADARRNDHIAHVIMDVGHELAIFAEKNRLPPEQLSRYLDDLHREIEALQQAWPEEASVLSVISRSVVSTRVRWQSFFASTPWTDLTADAMQGIVADVKRELSIVRTGFTSIARNPGNRDYRDALQKILRLARVCDATAEKFANYSELHLTRAALALPEIEQFLDEQHNRPGGTELRAVIEPAGQATFAFRSALYAMADEGRSGVTSSSDSLLTVAHERYAQMLDSLQALQAAIDADIAATQAETLDRVMQARAFAIALLLVSVLFALVASFRLQRSLTRGFERLLDGVAAFSRGDFTTRIPESGAHELRTIARGFNGMAESLLDRDVERHMHLEAMEQSRRQADEANAAKSRFLASMSHEIRTPMNGVLGMAELLAAETLTPRQRSFVETVQESGKTLLALINDILDLSKIEAGHLELDPVPFRLCTLVEGVGQLMAPVAQRKGLELAVIVDHAIEERRLGDATRIRQVLLNLIGNAIKFTAEGSVTLRVGQSADKLRFEVMDTGVGISPADQARIFQPFSQIVESARGTTGTGLGLSICNNLVELMDGRMEVHSQVGRGSTFSFEIDLPPVTEDATLPAGIEPPRALAGEGARMAFVCSRSRGTLDGLQQQLQRMGVACRLAATARDAVSQLKRALQDGVTQPVLLLDRQLEDVGGLEFVHRLRDALPSAPIRVIALCDAGDEAALQDAWAAAGIETWLYKPVTQSALLDAWVNAGREGQGAASAASRSASATETAPQEPDIAERGTEVVSARVLVAEDNAVNQQVVSHMLEALDCEVVIAANGRRCIEALERDTFDLVLMDCDMPDMDGFQATAAIRRREGGNASAASRQAIVALTANALQGDRERCLAAGMDDFLSKPFSMAQLEDMLARYVPGFGAAVVEEDGALMNAPENRKAA